MGISRVASIHFAESKADRNYPGGAFFIPPVGMGAPPFELTCTDSVQKDWGAISTGPGGGRRTEHRWLVTGEEKAADIVKQWTVWGLGMTPQRHPGIWVVRDQTPVSHTDPATGVESFDTDLAGRMIFRPMSQAEAAEKWEEDLAHARAADRNYAEWCWADGNRIAELKGGKMLVPENYKLAARRYGLDADWLKEATALESMPCPSCGKIVSRSTYVCQYCQQPTDLERWAQWQARRDLALREAKKELTAA